MPSPIDRDRPMIVWRQPIRDGGMYVYMYFDDPGVYFAANGAQVPAELAKSFGADTAKYDKERRRKMALQDAADRIERELDGLDDEAPIPDKIVAEANGFRVLKVGDLGMAIIEDAETREKITTAPVPLEVAMQTFEHMTKPVEPGVLPKPSKPQTGKAA